MTFSTFTFFAFAAACFAFYWSLPSRRTQNLLLLVASYVFYGWWDPRFCVLILLSSAVDYGVGLGLERSSDAHARRRKWLLATSVVMNIGMLATFKYFDFFAESLAEAAGNLGWRLDPPTSSLVLPVGISFYTFQTLGYTIDVYRRRLRATSDPLDYFTYVAFFPQLVAGPIERGGRLLPQFARPREFDYALSVDGARLLLWGFVQKAALADNLATIVDACYGSACRGPMAMIATACFAFQIYWDFAGYSNMAIGTARLFGFTLSRNFAYPYFSRSMGEFWRRWHITLSTWFRDYVYVPLGGSRRGPVRVACNVLLTFALSGLWHGPAWTFVVWGLLNGLLTLPSILYVGRDARRGLDDIAGTRHLLPSPAVLARMLGTFVLACIGWVFFRSQSLEQATGILTAIARDLFDPIAWGEMSAHADYLRGFLPLAATVVFLEWLTRRHDHPLVVGRWPRPLRWLLYSVLLWGTLYLMPEDPHRFIYFQF